MLQGSRYKKNARLQMQFDNRQIKRIKGRILDRKNKREINLANN